MKTNMKKMNILVTGATGTVGSEVIKQLSKENVNVFSAVHTMDRCMHTGNCECIGVDYDKPETIREAMDGIDKLFLLTPFSDKMVDITKLIVDEAKKAGVRHIVKLSAMGAAKEGITPLKWHYQAEEYIKKSGLNYTFLRPAMFMQNFINFNSDTIKNMNAIYVPAGDGRIRFVNAKDIASVAVKCLVEDNHQGKTYTLTGPDSMSYDDAAKAISKVTGHEIKYVPVSESEARKGMKEMPQWMIDSMMDLFRLTREGKMEMETNDVKIVTGKEPIKFTEFVKENKSLFCVDC